MKAVRLVEARRLEVVDVPDPEPADGEVLLRVAATGICGSDLSCFKTGVFAGAVLGHEISGFVEAVAAGVDGWLEGDAVAVDPKIPCGTCSECVSGEGHRCAWGLTLGIGQSRDGGFAERVAVPARLLHRLPSSIDPVEGCLVEPLSVALHGLDRLGPVTGHRAIVWGLGPIGLLTVAALRAAGAAHVAGVDPAAGRRRLAAALGAGVVVEPGDAATKAAIGCTVSVECSGRGELVQEAANWLMPGGRLLLLGVPMSEATIYPMVWVTRELSVFGAVGSAPKDFPAAIDLLAAEPSIASVLTRRVALADVPAAFEALLAPGEDAKVAAVP